MDIFKGLLDHFQGMANALEDRSLAATVFPDTADRDASKEDLLASFLTSHLPDRCQVIRGGHVFDSCGTVSEPIDLLLTSDLAIRLQGSDKSYHCLEGCYCAICISQVLDKSACVRSLECLASVPLLPEVPAGLGFLFGSKPQNALLKVVFAFDGPGPETTLADIEGFYTANDVPEKGRPNLVIVNNRYGIVRTGEEGAVTEDGVEIPANAFHAFGCATSEPYSSGYSLMYLLTEIQRTVASGSQTVIDYAAYLDQLPL